MGLVCRSLPVRLPWRRSHPETYKERYPSQGNSSIWRCVSLCDKLFPAMLILWDQLFLTFVCSSTLLWGLRMNSYRKGRSFYAFRIYNREFTGFVHLCESHIVQWGGVLYTCQQLSYVYALCSELAPTHESSLPCHWQDSVSFCVVACIETFTF